MDYIGILIKASWNSENLRSEKYLGYLNYGEVLK